MEGHKNNKKCTLCIYIYLMNTHEVQQNYHSCFTNGQMHNEADLYKIVQDIHDKSGVQPTFPQVPGYYWNHEITFFLYQHFLSIV